MKNIKKVTLEPSAFIGDVDFQLMNAEQRGVYWSIILYLYANGGELIMNNEDITLLGGQTNRLANLSNCFKSGQEWTEVWDSMKHKFSINGNILTHKRVTQELRKAHDYFLKRSAAGKKGMEKRWEGHNSDNNEDITIEYNIIQCNDTKEEKNKEKKKKIRHLEYVLLTDEQYLKLMQNYGHEVADDFIKKLNNYIGSKGKKYKSHYHTILTWMRNDGIRPKGNERNSERVPKIR